MVLAVKVSTTVHGWGAETYVCLHSMILYCETMCIRSMYYFVCNPNCYSMYTSKWLLWSKQLLFITMLALVQKYYNGGWNCGNDHCTKFEEGWRPDCNKEDRKNVHEMCANCRPLVGKIWQTRQLRKVWLDKCIGWWYTCQQPLKSRAIKGKESG